jgi:hypothetical protein
VGSVDTPDFAYAVALSSDHACVADSHSGFQILPAQCESLAEDSGLEAVVALPELHIAPNPGPGRCETRLQIPASGPVRVSLHDPTGRRLRDLTSESLHPGGSGLSWDGCDAAGHPVPAGVYLGNASTLLGTRQGRITVLR